MPARGGGERGHEAQEMRYQAQGIWCASFRQACTLVLTFLRLPLPRLHGRFAHLLAPIPILRTRRSPLRSQVSYLVDPASHILLGMRIFVHLDFPTRQISTHARLIRRISVLKLVCEVYEVSYECMRRCKEARNEGQLKNYTAHITHTISAPSPADAVMVLP